MDYNYHVVKHGKAEISFLSMKFFYPISQISYSAYLFHEMFMFWLFPQFNEFALGRLSETQIFLGNGLISLLAILLASTLMYMFIEQPFQDIKQKIKFVEKQQKGV